MSMSPYLDFNTRWGSKLGHQSLIDEMITDGLWCPFNNLHMGQITEQLAKKNNITRYDQDVFSYESNLKALQAIKENKFNDEIVGVEAFDNKAKNKYFKSDGF